MLAPHVTRALAAEKWPGVTITAFGEWALLSLEHGKVRSVALFVSEGDAYRASERATTGWKIDQLKLPTPVPER